MSLNPSIQFELRSLYRSFLRELPLPPTISSPTHHRLRKFFTQPQLISPVSQPTPRNTDPSPSPSVFSTIVESSSEEKDDIRHQIQATKQYLIYLRAQRTYLQLLERYNPGVALDVARGRPGQQHVVVGRDGTSVAKEAFDEDPERVEATARRVGMVLPTLYTREEDDKTGGDSESGSGTTQ